MKTIETNALPTGFYITAKTFNMEDLVQFTPVAEEFGLTYTPALRQFVFRFVQMTEREEIALVEALRGRVAELEIGVRITYAKVINYSEN